MLKIRDFARLAEVSMTTLRYYDEIGLGLTQIVDWSDVLDAMLKRYGVTPIDHLLVLHPESEGRLTRCELPAFPHMASILHQGPPSLVMPAYQALGTWMENNADKSK